MQNIGCLYKSRHHPTFEQGHASGLNNLISGMNGRALRLYFWYTYSDFWHLVIISLSLFRVLASRNNFTFTVCPRNCQQFLIGYRVKKLSGDDFTFTFCPKVNNSCLLVLIAWFQPVQKSIIPILISIMIILSSPSGTIKSTSNTLS